MNEKLKKEAEEYLKQKLEERKDKFVFELPEVYIEDVKEAYIAGAEPREKRIAELEARCNELFLQTCEQAEKIKELKDYRLTTVAKQQTDMSKYALNLEHKLSWYDDQLTKAKELLKRCYDNYICLDPLRSE